MTRIEWERMLYDSAALTQLVEIAQMGQSPPLEDRYLVAEHFDIRKNMRTHEYCLPLLSQTRD